MNDIIDGVRAALRAHADEATRISGRRFFKEEVLLYGVKTAAVRGIAKDFDKRIGACEKGEIFAMCEQLWRSGYLEESFVACHWAERLHSSYEPDDFIVFARWLERYVGNWASCDTLCNHTIGSFIERYPQCIDKLKEWAASENRWLRRAAAVSLIIPARRGRFLEDILVIADILLRDEDDLVRKGYGWMLKAASQAHQQEIFDYVVARRKSMPRTALRYAIEKMPPAMKAKAMEK